MAFNFNTIGHLTADAAIQKMENQARFLAFQYSHWLKDTSSLEARMTEAAQLHTLSSGKHPVREIAAQIPYTEAALRRLIEEEKTTFLKSGEKTLPEKVKTALSEAFPNTSFRVELGSIYNFTNDGLCDVKTSESGVIIEWDQQRGPTQAKVDAFLEDRFPADERISLIFGHTKLNRFFFGNTNFQ